jgi:SAM-dependent methyltransferase
MKDGYHSAYWAELYDLGHDLFPWLNEDGNIFLGAYKDMRARRPLEACLEDKYIFVDIGCGTGRVFNQLADNLVQTGGLSDRVQFIGLDYSAHMLKRATAKMPKALSHCIKYVQGSATDLFAVEEFQGPPTVDVLTFAAGSISMLMEPGQAEKFLVQAAGVLRPKKGRALISVRYVFDDSRQAEQAKMQERMFETSYSQDTPSSSFPGILYRQGKEIYRREGNLVFWDLPVQVIKVDANGLETVIDTDVASMGGRVWKDGELLLAATTAGLELVETCSSSNETMYVFKRG